MFGAEAIPVPLCLPKILCELALHRTRPSFVWQEINRMCHRELENEVLSRYICKGYLVD